MHLSSPQESRFQTAQEVEDNHYMAEFRDQQYQYPMAELGDQQCQYPMAEPRDQQHQYPMPELRDQQYQYPMAEPRDQQYQYLMAELGDQQYQHPMAELGNQQYQYPMAEPRDQQYRHPMAELTDQQYQYPMAELGDQQYEYPMAKLTDQQYQYPMAKFTARTFVELPTVPEHAAIAELHGSLIQHELGEGIPVAEMASGATSYTPMQVLDVEASTPVSAANPMHELFEYRESGYISPVSPFPDEQVLPAKLPGISTVVFSPEGYSRLPVDDETIYTDAQSVSAQSLPILGPTSASSSSVHGPLHEVVHELSGYTPTPSLSIPDSLVVDLLNKFRVQLAESIQKMREPPMSVAASSLVEAIAGRSAETHLEFGLLAFRKMLQGSLDVEPRDILGFSFLVVAITTILDREDLLHTVYVDVLQQCHAITDCPQKFTIMELLGKLWSPSNQSSLFRELSSGSQTSRQVTQPGSHSVFLGSGTSGVNTLPGGHQTGVTMHLCLQYFDSELAYDLAKSANN